MDAPFFAPSTTVEDRVRAVLAGERVPQLPLADGERARLTRAVEHAGNEPLAPQATGVGAATLVASFYLEPYSLSRHTGREV